MGNTLKIETVESSENVWRIVGTDWVVTEKDSSIVTGKLIKNNEGSIVIQNFPSFNYNDPLERILFNNSSILTN